MRDLTLKNPILQVRLKRLLRSLLPGYGQKGSAALLWAFVLVTLALVIAALAAFRESIQPSSLLYVAMTLVLIVAVAVNHDGIAGERERQSLDTLLTTPISTKQLVVGKFGVGALAVVAVMVAHLIPMGALALARIVETEFLSGRAFNNQDSFSITAAMFLVCVLIGLQTCAWVTLISSRASSAGKALLASVALGVVAIFLLPAFLLPILFESGIPLLWHPYVALIGIQQDTSLTQGDFLSPWAVVALQAAITGTVIYGCMAAAAGFVAGDRIGGSD